MAVAQADDPGLTALRADSSLQLQHIPLALSDSAILLCDMSTGFQCPYVPESFQ